MPILLMQWREHIEMNKKLHDLYIVNEETVRKLAKLLYKASTVSFNDDNSASTTVNGHISLPRPPGMCSYREYCLYIYKMFHETEHNRDGKDLWKKAMAEGIMVPPMLPNGDTDPLGYLHNLITDMMNDYVNYDEYPGIYEAINIGSDVFFMDGEKKIEGHTWDNDLEKSLGTMWYYAKASMGNYLPAMSNKYAYLAETQEDEQVISWLYELKQGDYAERLRESLNPVVSIEILKEIYRDVFKMDLPESPRSQESGNEGNCKGDSEDSEEGEGNQGDTDEEGSGKPDKKRRRNKAFAKFKDLLFHEHKEDGSVSEAPLTITYDSEDLAGKGSWTGYPVKERFTFTGSNYGLHITDAQKSPGLAKTVQRLLSSMQRNRNQGDVKEGRLNNPALHRIISMGDGTDSFQKIFKKKIPVLTTKETAVYLLIDCSGSMHGTKYRDACIASIRLAQCIVPLRCSLKIAGFTQTRHNEHYIFKNWHEPMHVDKIIKNMAGIPEMAANSDGDSIVHSFHDLQKSPKKNKILIVLSDGQPAGECISSTGKMNVASHTKEVISQIEKSPVTIYGIGIEDNSVKRFYNNYIIIQDSSELDSALITLVKDNFLKQDKK
jgi:hypothetical protein